MAWTQIANFKGDPGDPGSEVELRTNAGNIEWRLGTGSWSILISLATLTGPAGADGTSVTITGSVADAAALGPVASTLTSGDAGKGYITQDDGHLHVWDGDSFNDVGTVRGPAGVDGDDGAPGEEVSLQVSGGFIQWRLGTGTWTNLIATSALKGDPGDTGARGTQIFDGDGVPGTIPGAAPGDYYLDNLTGSFYKLA